MIAWLIESPISQIERFGRCKGLEDRLRHLGGDAGSHICDSDLDRVFAGAPGLGDDRSQFRVGSIAFRSRFSRTCSI